MAKLVNDDMLEERLNEAGFVAVAFLDRTEKSSQIFSAQFEDVRKAFHKRVYCCTLDLLEHPAQKAIHKIYSIPVAVLFHNGVEIARYDFPCDYKLLCERMSKDIQRK